MRRILTTTQKQAITKAFCLLLGIALIVSVFCIIPYVAKAIPKPNPKSLNALFGGTRVMAEEQNFSLGLGTAPSTEPESIEPEPESAEPEPESTEPEPESTEPEHEISNSPPEESEPEPPKNPSDSDLPVFANNLCWYSIGEKAELNLINRTDFDIDLNDYLGKNFPIKGRIEASPLVLIVHTHGTESYLESGHDFYSPSEPFRSEEKARTVVHIGEVLETALESYGIPVLHDETMYDKDDYSKSYINAQKGITKTLSDNPSIKFVIDIHRDSVFDSSGRNIKPLTTIDGKKCAQLMLVVGTNQGGANHPNWRDNLTVATKLQSTMNTLYPTLARPINLRASAFNQALTKGSLILEVGSCGNTVEEAENAITLFAKAYAKMIKDNMG